MKTRSKRWTMVVALGVTLASYSTDATASTYTVEQCTGSQGTVSDVKVEGSANYQLSNSCGFANGFLEATSGAATSGTLTHQYAFTAPSGTRMTRVAGTYGLAGHPDPQGNQAFIFVRNVAGGGDQTVDQSVASGASFVSNFDTDSTWASSAGAIDRIGIGVTCTRSASQACPSRNGVASRLSNLEFTMEDFIRPSNPQMSGTALNGWVNGTKAISQTVSDGGAGVHYGYTTVNGEIQALANYCTPDVTRLRPCPTSGSSTYSGYDVSQAPFREGENLVTSCVHEYGTNSARACTDDVVKVDTVAPGPPANLVVGGGQGWRRDNSFDLNWVNPDQNHAPIVGATLRLTAEGGGVEVEYHFDGAGISAIDDVEVPGVGDWKADVYLQDAAGNSSAALASTAHLRFDDTVAPSSLPERANGWVSREELAAGYLQEWAKPRPQQTPPSGIAGYRVIINSNEDTDPCSGSSDPRTCGGPLTEMGVNTNSRLLTRRDVAEGVNFVHVAPVSGSGMRPATVGHAPLKVDLTDPETVLRGDGAGEWMNRDAELSLVAIDSLSGMQDTDEFPFDAPPRVEMTVEGETVGANGPTVSKTVSSEGVHEVNWCARDLAGNGACAFRGGADASSGSAVVRIDKTQPAVAFTNSQDPEDPDKLMAPVSDGLSGVAGGQISYRVAGGAQWKTLETQLRDGRLVARVDSVDMSSGVTYEFRAVAVDRAGNASTSMNRENGEPMKVVGPFRPITEIIRLTVNGKSKTRLRYGKRAVVDGQLVTSVGSRPVAAAQVEVVEDFAVGSKLKRRASSATTDSSGRFSIRIRKGPSRSISAAFRGDRRYLGGTSNSAGLRVKSKVTLATPARVRSDDGIVFKGRVKCKGAKLGRKGKRLEVQVQVGKRWRTVGRSIRTSRKGSFKLPYDFTADYTRPVEYTFRAVVLRERGFPYLPAKSKIRRVTVTP